MFNRRSCAGLVVPGGQLTIIIKAVGAIAEYNS